MPYELMEALWCERYTCLPWELDGSQQPSAERLLLHGQLLGAWRAFQKLQAGRALTPGEDRIVGEILQLEMDNG